MPGCTKERQCTGVGRFFPSASRNREPQKTRGRRRERREREREELSCAAHPGGKRARPPIIRLPRARQQRGESKAAGPRLRVKAGFPTGAAVCGSPCRPRPPLWATQQEEEQQQPPCYLQRRRPRLARERWLGQERGRSCARTTAAAPALMARPPRGPPPGLASTTAPAPASPGAGS